MKALPLTQEQKLEMAGSFVGFKNIPRDELNDEVVARVLIEINEFMKLKNSKPIPEGTGYYEAAYAALSHHSMFASHVHSEFIDRPMADLFSAFQVGHLARKVGDRITALVDQDKVAAAIKADINVVKDLPASMVTDEAIKEAVRHAPKRSAAVLLDVGRLNVVQELISEGFWPHRESDTPARVDGAEEAIKLRMKKRDYEKNHEMWLNALIKTHPVEEVVSLMKTPARKKLLVQLYEREEISHLIKDDKLTKGLFLSEALGL
jgi:hypothetical protein